MTTATTPDLDIKDLKIALAAIDHLLYRNQSLCLGLIADARQTMIEAIEANENEDGEEEMSRSTASILAAEVHRVAEEAHSTRRAAFAHVMDEHGCDPATRDTVAKYLGLSERERSCGWDD